MGASALQLRAKLQVKVFLRYSVHGWVMREAAANMKDCCVCCTVRAGTWLSEGESLKGVRNLVPWKGLLFGWILPWDCLLPHCLLPTLEVYCTSVGAVHGVLPCLGSHTPVAVDRCFGAVGTVAAGPTCPVRVGVWVCGLTPTLPSQEGAVTGL